MTRRSVRSAAVAFILALTLAACESGIQFTEHGSDSAVLLMQGSEESASSSLAPSFSVAAASGPISLDRVASIDVTITRVEAVRRDTATAGKDSVVVLNLSAPAKINLLALPTTQQNAIQLARGNLPVGTYGNIRLVFSDATITFKEDVVEGNGKNATTLKANTAYPLDIGGGQHQEIKLPGASVTITANTGATIPLMFDAGASIKKIIITGNGQIKMPPVIHVKKKD